MDQQTTASVSVHRIPVTILGGYLGAGKTTLINRMLSDNPSQRLAILVNDFGAINVDANLIDQHDGQTISLTNGCVCCSIAGDLGSALASVSAMSRRPDRIVIEASGVSDPERVANYARGQEAIGIDGIVVLADAETVRRRTTDRFVGTTVRRQLVAADLVILTKVDLVSEPALEQVRTWLCSTYPAKPIVSSRETDAAALLIDSLPVNCRSSSVVFESWSEQPAEHDANHVAMTVDCPNPIDRTEMTEALRSLDGSVLRCKGWVRFNDAPHSVVLVQGVGARLEFVDTHPGLFGSRPRLVIICRNDGVSVGRVKMAMRALSSSANIEERPTLAG